MDILEQAEQMPAPDLFSWADSLARSRDPETSKQAAAGIQKQLGGFCPQLPRACQANGSRIGVESFRKPRRGLAES
jgi:hypothetical protein